MKESWDTITKRYPNQWVVLKNVSFSESDIKSAEIVCAKNDSEIIDYLDKHLDDNYIFRRTTEGAINEPFSANFTIQLD